MSPDRDVPPDDRSGAPDPDVDAVFAQIVAGWDDDEAPPVPPWPATEDVPERRSKPVDRAEKGAGDRPGPAPDAEDPTSDASAAGLTDRRADADRPRAARDHPAPDRPAPDRPAPDRPAPDRAAGGPPAPGPRDWDAAEEPEEGYVPPEPPPLPRGDLVSRLAWAGVLLGPAFLLLSALLWDGAGPLPLAIAALAFIGGFVTLVARLPARRDDEDDDGAVV
jgi:hypothetical protein